MTDPTVDAVVFDYGGVLTTPLRVSTGQWLDTDRIDPDSFFTVMREWLGRQAEDGTPVHRLETGELPGAEFEQVLAARLVTVDGGAVAGEGLLARMFAAMAPDPEMFELLGELRAAGTLVGLLSNSWANTYPANTAELFDAVVISGEVGLRKPDPRIYRLVLDRLGVPAERTVFVDDAPMNVEAAAALGMRAVRHEDAAATRDAIAELVPTVRRAA